ncbi:MAG: hypothetical protein M2R45_04400 [Verrucomicrobia subdivision 3 bacterium]|nr:hypothetical protein [Limisphaerales bacterium]MCS1417262.1 hypothetical protein [Limisphaerales bacterium]
MSESFYREEPFYCEFVLDKVKFPYKIKTVSIRLNLNHKVLAKYHCDGVGKTGCPVQDEFEQPDYRKKYPHFPKAGRDF